MRFVVCTDAAEENFVTQPRAQHVQHPSALLIIVRIKKFEEILGIAIEDGCTLLFLVVENIRGRVVHIRLKSTLAFVALDKQRREVCREAFTQPQIGPRRLCN
ncbi:MAG TPA: hypothetical protein VFU83_03155 [Pyrinomonadaceae bacterium]|nr:hypothetical protein [Pyrinomonadaceae bacterium]